MPHFACRSQRGFVSVVFFVDVVAYFVAIVAYFVAVVVFVVAIAYSSGHSTFSCYFSTISRIVKPTTQQQMRR